MSVCLIAPPLGAQVTSFDEPLVDAIEQGNTSEANQLLRDRHPPNSRGKFDVTPLMRSAFKGNVTMTEMLLSAGANPNAVDVGGATALHLASREDKIDIVKMLIRYGAYVDMADAEGWTPLMRAVTAGRQNTARVLMEAGADVNVLNKQNESPLIKAAETRNSKLVRLLLMGGANPTQVNARGQSAVDIAREKNNPEVLAMLAPYQSPADAAVNAATAAQPKVEKPFFVLSVRDANVPAPEPKKPTDNAAMALAITKNMQGNSLRAAAPAGTNSPPAYQINPNVPTAPVANTNLPASLENFPSNPPQAFPVNPNQSIEDIQKEADRLESEKVAAARAIAEEEERKARLDAAKRATERIETARIEAATQAAGAVEAAKITKAKEEAAKESAARIEAAKRAIEEERNLREKLAALPPAPPVTVVNPVPPAPVVSPHISPEPPPEVATSNAPIDPTLPAVIELPPMPEIAAAPTETPPPEKNPEPKNEIKKAEKIIKPTPTENSPTNEVVDEVIVRLETPEQIKPPELPPMPEVIPAENESTPVPKNAEEKPLEPKTPSAPTEKERVKPPVPQAKTAEALDRERALASTQAAAETLLALKQKNAGNISVEKTPLKEISNTTPTALPKESAKASSDAAFWQQLSALENQAFTPPAATTEPTPAPTAPAVPTAKIAGDDLLPLPTSNLIPAQNITGENDLLMQPNTSEDAPSTALEALSANTQGSSGASNEASTDPALGKDEGRVDVAEAVRVPLSLPRNIRVVVVPHAKPNFDVRPGGWLGAQKSEPFRGYWIQVGTFASEEDAFQHFDKTISQEALNLRMKTLVSDNGDGTAKIFLRVGNFNNSEDAAEACNVFKTPVLTCSTVYELGKGAPIRSLALSAAPSKPEAFTYDSNPDRAIYWLQLGSFKDEAEVVENWKNLSDKHKDVLHMLKLSIQVPKGLGLKDNRYQMRAGPLYSRFEASGRCRKLKERDVTCLAVRGD